MVSPPFEDAAPGARVVRAHEAERGVAGNAGGAPAVAAVAAAAKTAPELRRPFRLIVVDWEIVVAAGSGEAARAVRLLDAVLATGARVAIVSGTGLGEVVSRIGDGIGAEALRRAYVVTHRGAELFGFDRRGDPVALFDAHDAAAPPRIGALAALFAQVIGPLRIGPHDVLVVGPEHGLAGDGAAGVPELAEAARAAAGARRLCEILEEQRDADAALGPFAPPRDAAWVIEEAGFDVAREHEIESLLAIANGYLGSRGSIAEGSSVSRPATFVAGAFEPSCDVSRVPELVIAPDWGRLRFVIEGEPFSVEAGEARRHVRTLDMRRGVLLRDCVAQGASGHVTHLRTLHAASLADRHVLLEGVRLSPQNFTGTIRIDAILCGEVKSASGASHWATFTPGVEARSLSLVGRTHGGLVAAMTSHLHAGADPVARCDRAAAERSVAERCEIRVRLGEEHDFFRTATLHTSRDAPDPVAAGEALRARIEARSVEEVLRDHERAWAARWRHANVEIDGAPKIERALRFALYHLIGTANPDDPRCSIGARSLSGEAYRGHVFWDTEIFMVPFFTHCWPEAARALLGYRHLTLPGARRKAEALGYAGALYAWESADTGDETTPSVVISPTGELMRILTGEQEHHISADVAYAVWSYVSATGDAAFARGEGAEILVETARFWASRVTLGAGGRAHIRKVIGPDEYHEEIDDNAYTNWMARFNLRCAVEVVSGGGAEGTAARLGVRPDEVARWRSIADAMVLGVDAKTGLIEQFAGYFGLAPFAIADFGARTAPIDLLLGRQKTQACQVVKQADVVQLIALLWDQVPPAARRDNFLHYEPRTAHGSSLSPGIHALVSARLDLYAHAERYFDQTADIDLGNNMGNAAGGVHAAGLGSLWQAVVFGAAGVRAAPGDGAEEAIGIEPHLLPGWRHLAVPLQWRGRALEIHVEPDAVEIAVEGGRPLPVRLLERDAPAATILAEPGRRYAARRGNEGFGSWEEIGS